MESHPIKDVESQCGKRVRHCSEREVQLQRLLCAEVKVCKEGLRGKSRFDYLKRFVRFDERTDDSQVRRMLREARLLFAKAYDHPKRMNCASLAEGFTL